MNLFCLLMMHEEVNKSKFGSYFHGLSQDGSQTLKPGRWLLLLVTCLGLWAHKGTLRPELQSHIDISSTSVELFLESLLCSQVI